MTISSGLLIAGLGTTLIATSALAQATAPAGSTVPKAPSTIQDGRSDSLSGKLEKSNGVIKPKGDLDPRIEAPAPVAQPNSMPVIPPSANGGQNAK